MAIEGALQDVALADICQLLAMGRKTGCLSLTDRSNFGYIYFQDGRVIHASLLNRPDRLGELLVRNNVITRAQLSAAMEAQAHERGARLGELLVRTGALTEDQLQRYISLQIEEAVYHLFTWSQGSFHFDPDQLPDEGVFLINLPAENLLLEGARRVDEWGLIEKKIPSLDLVFAMEKDPAEAGEDVELTPEQKKLIPLVDGQRTVEELVHESGMVEFEVAKAMYGLVQAGFAGRAGQRDDAATGEGGTEIAQHLNLGIAFYRSGMMEDAVREFQTVLKQDPKHPRALFRLALIGFRAGRLQEALDYFERMPEDARNSYSVLRNRALALSSTWAASPRRWRRRSGRSSSGAETRAWLWRVASCASRPATWPARWRSSGPIVPRPTSRSPRPSTIACCGLAAALAGELEYAVQVGREGLTHYPACGPLLVNAGAVLERRGEVDAAEAHYARAIQTQPIPAQAHKNLGDQAWAHGDQHNARVHYEKAVKLEPRLGDDIYLRLGTIAHKDQDLDVARLLWRRALELNPHNDLVRTNLESLQG